MLRRAVAAVAAIQWVGVPEWPAAQEWALGEASAGLAGTGVAETGAVAAIGTVATGIGVIGAVATIGTAGIGTATTGRIGTADGAGGMVTGGVTPIPTSFSLVASASHGGGVGAGARGLVGAGTPAITATVIPTVAILTVVTAMAMIHTDMVMDMVTVATYTATKAMGTAMVVMAMPATPEWPSCSGDFPAPVITTAQLTESWGLQRDGRSERTSRSTGT